MGGVLSVGAAFIAAFFDLSPFYSCFSQGASGNRKTSTYGTNLPRFERKKICQIAAGRNF